MADNQSSGGIGVSGLLGVAFIILKLTHYIDWDWVWVLSPFWIPLVIVLGIFAVPLAIMGVLAIFQKIQNLNR